MSTNDNYSNSPEHTNIANTVKSTFSEANEILKYKQLLDAGVITQEEFDSKKKQILNLDSAEIIADTKKDNHLEVKVEQEDNASSSLSTASEPMVSSPSNNPNNKQPIYMKWWFWVVIIMSLSFVIGIANSGESSKDPNEGTHGEDETGDNTGTVSNEKGSKNNPYVLSADAWYADHCAGTSTTQYINQYVKVTGMVLNISDYNTLKGYYLVGGPGCGLICWVESGKTTIQYGQVVEYIGKVTVEDSGHIEIAECEVLSVNWPTEKQKSPITISDWSWSRDYVGGVEWNFRLTNNTDKVVKYVSLTWNCYNSVGDLVYDEITGKSSHGVKYTGPLNPNETTGYLSNSSLFYSYSFKSSKFSILQVEFMDGTVIRINDKAYTDIYMQKLEAETVYGGSGIKYIVNNNLNTCYVAGIGNCTDTYIGILSSLYGDTVTHVGDYAFADVNFIQTVSITTTLVGIKEGAFMNCTSLTEIRFSGKIEDWYLIDKGENWDYNTGEYTIYCYDGQISKDGTVTYN